MTDSQRAAKEIFDRFIIGGEYDGLLEDSSHSKPLEEIQAEAIEYIRQIIDKHLC